MIQYIAINGVEVKLHTYVCVKLVQTVAAYVSMAMFPVYKDLTSELD